MKKFLAILLSVMMILSVFAMGLPAFAASLLMMQLDPQYAGTEITVSGMSSEPDVTVEIYAPDATDPIIVKQLTIEPNGAYHTVFTAQEGVFGKYKAVAKTASEQAEMFFDVIEKTADSDGEKEFEITNDYSEKEIGGVRVFVDGDAHKYSIDCFDKNGDVMVPLAELCGVIDIELSEVDGGWFLKKGLIELTLKEGSDKAEKLDRAKDTPETLTMSAALEKSGDVLAVPVGSIADAFGWHNTYDKEADIIAIGTREKDDWFYHFPTQSDWSNVLDVTAKSIRENITADFSWGLLQQRSSTDTGIIESADIFKLKIISYYESAGQVTLPTIGYLAEDFSKGFDANAWGMWPDRVNTSKYAHTDVSGIHLEINNDKLVNQMFTRESLGYSIPTYPDGTSALGYLEGTDFPYPLTAKVYDASCAKGIDGIYVTLYDGIVEPEYADAWPMKSTVGSSTLRTLEGYKEGDVVAVGIIHTAKDILAPIWREHSRVTVREMVTSGIDGMWCDNYGPWDSFANIKNCFGNWSEALFTEYLKTRHTAAELAEMGVNDISSFNIREYMVQTAIEYYGDADLIKGLEQQFLYSETSPAYQDTFWLDNAIWGAYKTFKSAASFQYIQDIYEIAKEEAVKGGLEDGFFVLGNDSPGVSHGFVESDFLDAVGAEMSNGWNLSFGSKGIPLLPEGRMAVYYKVANEFGSAPYCIPWYYSNGNDALKKTNVGKILLAEAFANNALMRASSTTIANDKGHYWLNTFIYENEKLLGTRYTKADIAIIFSTQNQLANMNPNYLIGAGHDKQYHTQGVWGTSHALAKANIPYTIIPEWQANAELLANYKTVVLPNLESMTDEMYEIYTNYAKNGGRLVITGPMGYRYGGDEGYFMKRDTALITQLLGVDITSTPKNDLVNYTSVPDSFTTAQFGSGTVVWSEQPLGNIYMTVPANRDQLSKLIIAMCGNDKTLIDRTSIPETVGAYLLQSKDGQDLFVDLVNYNVDLSNDKVTNTDSFTVKVKLPTGADHSAYKAYGLSPDGNSELAMTVRDGWAEVSVDSFKIYTSVKLSAKSQAAETPTPEPTQAPAEDTLTPTDAPAEYTPTKAPSDGAAPASSAGIIIAIVAVAVVAVAAVLVVIMKKKK